jgi:YbgC/YbaW family acyl-CoA thioester hydrolase
VKSRWFQIANAGAGTQSHRHSRMSFPGTIFESELAVRPDDLDMFQHVHSTVYLDYVLAARCDQMERFYGMAMQAFLDRGWGWVVRRSFIEYKRPLKLGGRMIIRTRVEEMHRHGVKVWFEILRLPERKLSCEGWCDYAMITLADGRATMLPEDVISMYSI